MDLTKRQQEIFDFIKRYSASYGYPPTVRDIGKAVGLASSSTVHAHLSNLERIGLLRRDPTKPRALVGEEATVKRFFQESDHVRLQPENATMDPIRSRDVRVLGKVVGLMRNIS